MKYRFQSIEHDLYLRAQIQGINRKPSDSRVQFVENLIEDISIDHLDADWGNEPIKGRYPPIIGECQEEEL